MMKRLFAGLLALAMVMSFVPAVVTAEPEAVIKTDKAGTHTADHKCEECGAVFTEWTSGDSLPGAGHYYLTKDVNLTKEIGVTGELHLCLNGYVVKATAGKRIFGTKDNTATELVITDCTAYTDAAGVYHAGALTGGQDASAGGGAVFVRKMGVMKVYDGRITQNVSQIAGGAITLQGKSGTSAGAKLYMYGGELTHNTALKADGTYKNGGAIYTGSGCVVELENVTIRGNTAIAGGAIYTGAMNSPIKLKNCVIEGNTATGTEGGGVFYSSYASFQLTDCEIVGNKAPNGGGGVAYTKTSGEYSLTNCTVKGNEAKNAGGAFRLQDKVNLTATGSTFTENKSGSGGSVIYYQNYCQVSLKDTTITGNIGTSTSSAGYSAAIYGVGGASKLTIGGKMVVADNTIASPNTADINFNNATTDILYVDGLKEGSRVFFSTKATPNAAAADLVSGTPTAWDDEWVTYMDENGQMKMIGYENGAFVFSEGHKHNGCNDAACTDHEEIAFAAWKDSASLPASGSWYLDTDVTIAKETILKSDLTLCLNGHTVTGKTASMRIFATAGVGGETLTLCDCTAKTVDGVYTAGKLTGSHNTNTGAGGGAIFLRSGGKLKLFDGIICDNSTVAGGGAIYASKATIEMHNGQFSGNIAKNAAGEWKTGGAIYLQDTAMTMYGGEITGNESNDGAGIHLAGASSLEIRGGKVTGNIAHKEGAGVNVASAGSKLTVSGNVQITGNTLSDGTASNLRLRDGNIMTVGTVDSQTLIGVNATAFKPISGKTEDYTKNFISDDIRLAVIYKDGALFMDTSDNHKHCLCGGDSANGCDHEKLVFAPWTSKDTLPTSGNWYLDTDVVLSKEVGLRADLTLCLNGHTITGKTASMRIFSTAGVGGETLTISDCTAKLDNGVYTAGKLTGSHNTNTGAGGGAIFLRAGGELKLFDGIICDNSTVAGGGAIYANAATIEMHNGQFSGNFAKNAEGTWKTGGAIYLQDTKMVMYGGQITGNESNDGAGIHLAGASSLEIRGGKVTGNIAHNAGAGVYLASAGSTVAISGDVQILGNTLSGGKANNLMLRDGKVVTLGQLDSNTRIGISATPFKPVSTEGDDYSANFLSDDTKFEVVYKDKVLRLEATGNHKHCLCAGTTTTGCDHEALTFAPWEGTTTLPSSGNYYLTADVVLAKHTNLQNNTLRLCLNGHTITVGEQGGRAFRMYSESHLYLTDCGETAGKITGATQGAILSDSAGTNMSIDFWRIRFSGNHARSVGGAIIAQSDTTVNMHSGYITDNSSVGYLKVDGEGKPILDAKGNQTYQNGYGGGLVLIGGTFNMYGGEISGNKTKAVPYVKADGTTANAGGQGGGLYIRGEGNIYGGVIKNNEAQAGGGIYANSNGTVLKVYNAQITGNKASDMGAGICVNTGAAVELYTGTTVSGNVTPKLGAGAAASGRNAKLLIDGAAITGNQAKNAGGIYSQTYATVELKQGKISNNYATDAGGGVYSATNATFIMSGGSVTGNTAKADVGGIMCLRGKATITGGSVSNNTGANAGGICIYGTAATLSGVSVTGNRATGKPVVDAATGKTTYSGGNSGGIMIRNASLRGVAYNSVVYASGLYVANNKSNTAAGGLLIQSAGAQLYLSNSTFTGNESANSDAGAIYTSTGTKVQMKNITVTNNKAARAAGMNLYSSTVDITGLKMHGNAARGAGGSLAVAGANCQITVTDAEIYENEATSGGAVIVQSGGNLTLENGKLYNNKVKANGGAIYMNTPSVASLKNVEIFDNNAGDIGGAVFLYVNAKLTLQDATIRNNTAGKEGGAVFLRGRLEATNCKFLNNTGLEGGAIATGICAGDTVNDDAGAFLTDCILSGNQATQQGGAIYNHRGGPLYLTGSTITENTAGTEGGAIYSNGRLGLTDVTITGNTGTHAVYVTAAEFDGHSYTTGHKKLAGTVIIKDNQGGDLYLCENALMTVVGEQLGEKTHVEVTLASGVLSQYVLGVYGYEGSDLHYIITAGNRSLTDPERVAEPEKTQPQTQNQNQAEGNTLLYVAVGAIALIVVAAVGWILLKKKKTPAGENK